jgi:2'-hydroxyisoflavone reductase
MKLLVIGNTAFLGRGIIERAVQLDHDVTVVSKTQLDKGRFDGVEWIAASAADDVERMAGRNFDVVIDLSARDSDLSLRTSLTLADRVGLYVLISSTSVYRDFARAGIDESYPTAGVPDGVAEIAADFGTFGARLAACEKRVAEACTMRTLIIRTGMLTGPGDCSDRLPRVLARAELGGDMLAGSSARQPVQVLDIRDAADFILTRAEEGRFGLFNAVGDDVTLGEVMTAAAQATESDARGFYADDDFLARHGIEPMSQLPLWVPQKQYSGFFRISARRARAAGLVCRPILESLRDTTAFLRDLRTRGVGIAVQSGARAPVATLPRQAEQRIIDDFKRISNGKHSAVA